jgi:hypothetical protein
MIIKQFESFVNEDFNIPTKSKEQTIEPIVIKFINKLEQKGISPKKYKK